MASTSPELILAGLVLIVLVVLVVARPLLGPESVDHDDDERRAALEAAKESKYREIRDAELDFRMGKLSEHDYRSTDRELRAQAITILKRIDALEDREAEDAPPADAAANPLAPGRPADSTRPADQRGAPTGSNRRLRR